METIWFSETLVASYESKWRRNLEEHHHLFTAMRTSNLTLPCLFLFNLKWVSFYCVSSLKDADIHPCCNWDSNPQSSEYLNGPRLLAQTSQFVLTTGSCWWCIKSVWHVSFLRFLPFTNETRIVWNSNSCGLECRILRARGIAMHLNFEVEVVKSG
jgi:hypothetical protein